MAITKKAVLDAITIRPTGFVEIRTVNQVIDDDGLTVLGERYVRRLISPTDDISAEPLKIRQICQIARS